MSRRVNLHPPDREGTGRYVVVRPDEQHLEFDDSGRAIAELVDRDGYGELFSPSGVCLFTKGVPPSNRVDCGI